MKKTNRYGAFENPLHIYAIFGLAIAVVCFFIFVFNYKYAYDDHADGGGFIPPSLGVIFYHFIAALIFTATAFLIKSILKDKLNFIPLLIVALVLPIVCYIVNYNTLKKDGSFHFLVDKGGVFHFIAIGDYDFDGVNDKLNEIRNNQQISSSITGSSSGKIANIYARTTGVGQKIDGAFCSERAEDVASSRFVLHIPKNTSNIKSIELEIKLTPSITHDKISFFIIENDNEIPLSFDINNSKNIVITFDKDFYGKYQGSSDQEYFEVYIKYVIKE